MGHVLSENMDDECEMLSIKFAGSETISLSPREPEDFVYEHEGLILWLDDSDRSVEIGRVRAFYADLDTGAEAGLSAAEVLDAYEQTEEYAAIIAWDGQGYSEELEDLLRGETIAPNLLILDRLEILPSFRGKNIGLRICRRVIERFAGGCGLVAMKPFPLQFTSGLGSAGKEADWRQAMQLAALTQDEETATTKLKAYYGRLGFLELVGTPFMVRSTALRLPRNDELIQ